MYTYRGETYGPGEAEVPDFVLQAEDLTAPFRADLEGEELSTGEVHVSHGEAGTIVNGRPVGGSVPLGAPEQPEMNAEPDTEPEGAQAKGNAEGQGDSEELEGFGGLTKKDADALKAEGYDSPQDLADASDEELLAVNGIAEGKLKKLRSALDESGYAEGTS